jgi:hypothetical protein
VTPLPLDVKQGWTATAELESNLRAHAGARSQSHSFAALSDTGPEAQAALPAPPYSSFTSGAPSVPLAFRIR